MTQAFFTRFTDDHERFQPTDHCRGPWSVDYCHAGPPTGLLARAMELALPSQRLTRITVELIRPIPFRGFRVTANVLREGRTVSAVEAVIESLDGKVVISARGLFMNPAEEPLQFAEAVVARQPAYGYGTPDQASPGGFPISETLHDLPAFNGSGVATRYIDKDTGEPGETRAWLKTVPLFEDEEPSAFQRICPLADCGNAFGRLADPQDVTFMNTDLTVLLHRDPNGDWLGTDARCFWESNGIGMSQAMLFDSEGVVGSALQTLLLR